MERSSLQMGRLRRANGPKFVGQGSPRSPTPGKTVYCLRWFCFVFFFSPRIERNANLSHSSTFRMDSWEHRILIMRASSDFKTILNGSFGSPSEELRKKKGGSSSNKGALRGDVEGGHLLGPAQPLCLRPVCFSSQNGHAFAV